MFYITTSKPYANAEFHLGHAMDMIYADCLKRFFSRTDNNSITMWDCGTDENGLKIQETAQAAGIETQLFVDQKHASYLKLISDLELIPDIVDRSTASHHKQFANLAWQKLESKNLIYKKDYHGLYCKGCEDFYAQSQLTEDSKCPIHPHLDIQEVNESNFFFKLSQFKDPLLEYLEGTIVPDKKIINEMKNIVAQLKDISISRPKERVQWGVNVDSDPTQVMYVWFEALLTYLSSLPDLDLYARLLVTEDQDDKNKIIAAIWNTINEKMPVDLQIIGVDNSKFHLIIWPALLMALGLSTPQRSLIHGMITDAQGRKFAKSLGNGILLKDFVEQFGVEGVKFFVLHDCNSVGDTAYSLERFVDSYNANLANNLGNLMMRVTTLVEKHLNGMIDEDMVDRSITFEAGPIYDKLGELRPEQAFQLLFEPLTALNQYLESNKPWTLAKDMEVNRDQVTTILSTCVYNINKINEVLSIFLPGTSELIHQALNGNLIVKAPVLFQKIDLATLTQSNE
jgi:methionyl-tRNA synthetase